MSMTITQTPEISRSRSPKQAINGHAVQRPQLSSYSIDIADPSQVAHWSRYFGATPTQRCSAVEKVGSNPSIVHRLLRMR